jgi:hypothetical protein
LFGALGFCVASYALAGTTNLTTAAATKGSGNVPVTMQFPLTRTGDLAYETVLNFHTVDGTAFAGADYTAASASIAIPAGASSAMISVTLSANTGAAASSQFQMMLDTAVGIGPTPTFAAQQPFSTGAIPYSVTAADVNGDGKLDLIESNLGGSVSVLLNTTAPGATTPSFATQQSFTTGTNSRTVTAADVNGDGKPDLIVPNFGDSNVSVLLNTTAPGATTPGFATQQIFVTGGQPYSATAVDVNGDGKADLVVANYLGNTVSVLLNTTAPGATTLSFAAQQPFATGSHPTSVTAADVNGDGKPDLIVANLSDSSVSVLLNATAPGATTPAFSAQQTLATGNQPYSVTAVDVNGDGKPDLVAANSVGNSVSVLLNTTAPGATTLGFPAQRSFAAGTSPYSVSAADVNGDGKPDLVVANSGDNTASVLLNTTVPGATAPSFAAQQILATGRNPYSVIAANVNGDGKPDLIVANLNDDTVSVLLNTTVPGAATLGFAAPPSFGTGTHPYAFTTADVNGDGKPDLVVANSGDNNVSVLLNNTAPGAPTPSFAARWSFLAGTNPYWVTAADVNGDGKPDLVVANYGESAISVLLNTTTPGASTPSFAVQQTFQTGRGPVSVAATDVNGDGKLDLVVADFSDNDVSVLLNTTSPGAATPTFATQQIFAAGTEPRSVVAADVNGDGRPDLIVANNGDSTVSVLLNTTTPGATTLSFATQQTFATGSAGSAPFSIVAADVNGDGKSDLIAANEGATTVSVLLNTTTPGATTASFAAQHAFAVGVAPKSVVATDVDGDGKPDLIAANAGAITVSVLLNTTAPGATTPGFAAQQTYSAGGDALAVVATDVNGDGRPDLIATNDFGHTVSVLLNTQYQTALSGSPAAGTIVHDYIFADGFGP